MILEPMLTIPLKPGESPDQAIFDFVTQRGLLAKMLHWQYKPDSWASEPNRIACLVEDIRPCIPKDKTLTIKPDGSWELV
jgi:hypothetical protein